MTETVSVSVSGAALSLLFYENIKSEYDQDGFLLGTIVAKETKRVTDADYRVVNKERIVKIQSVLPCPQQFYFYNAAGKINVEKIKTFLGEQETNVVGWYIFKRKCTSMLRLTFREKIIHKQLAESFLSAVPYFTCCLLTSENSVSSTYSFCQTFVRYSPPKYENLPLHVVNLSDPSYTLKSAESTSEVLNKVIKSVKKSGECEGHLIVKKVQDGLQQHMKNLVAKSIEKELQLFKLEQEVKNLKQQQKFRREYGVQENKGDPIFPESEITENGTSSESTPTSFIESSPENPRKKRGRQRKNVNPVNSNSVNQITTNTCDVADDHPKENEAGMLKANRITRSKTNLSYSEIAQRSSN